MRRHSTNSSVPPCPRPRLALCLGVLWLVVQPLSAQAEDSRWILRGYGLGWYGIDDQVSVTRPEDTAIHRVSDGSGFGLGLEYMATRRLGVEAGVLFGDLDTDLRFESGAVSSDQIRVYTPTVGLNYHFAPGRRAAVFAGVFLGQSNFSDPVFSAGDGRPRRLSFDDDYGVGLKVGVDVPFRPESHWGFAAEVRYLLTILESEVAGEDLDLDPLIPSIGVSYRF